MRQAALNNSRPTRDCPSHRRGVCCPSMQSLDLKLTYAQALPNGGHRLFLDVFPAIPTSHGPAADAFKAHFALSETNENATLRSLRGTTSLEQVLTFFGATWSDALGRWPTLSRMHQYRSKHGPDSYASVEAWQQFYGLLSDKILPSKIEVALIEHY